MGGRSRGQTLALGSSTMLLLLVCVHAETPEQTLTSFLLGLGPETGESAGDACLLTAADRDELLKQLAQSNLRPSPPVVANEADETYDSLPGIVLSEMASLPDVFPPASVDGDNWRQLQSSRGEDPPHEDRRLTSQCVSLDYGATDTYGDDCNDYTEFEWCGGYDDDDFSAFDMCCLCDGGSSTNAPTPVPTSSPPSATPSPTTVCFDFIMYDHYADSWNGAKYVFRRMETNTVVATGTLSDGFFQGTDNICLDSGCYLFRVTSGSNPSEIQWVLDTMGGGAPFVSYISVADDGAIEGPFESCPTPTPTSLTPQPTPSPTVTSGPTVTPAPSTQGPTPSPTTPSRIEVRTWDDLDNALQIDRMMANVTRDLEFTQAINVGQDVDGGQDVTAFCDMSDTVSSGADFCATLGGGGETRLFVIFAGSFLRLIGLRLTNGGGATFDDWGGAVEIQDGASMHLTACTVNNNQAGNGYGGAFHLYNGASVHLTACTVDNNQAFRGGVFYLDLRSSAYLTACVVKNNYAGESVSSPFPCFARCHMP